MTAIELWPTRCAIAGSGKAQGSVEHHQLADAPASLPPEFEAEPAEEEPEEPKPLWQRLASFIVPIGVVLYILLSALLDR